MKKLFVWLALALAGVPSMAADTPAAQLFAELGGAWEGSGETEGMPARLRLQWEPVLDGAFTRLTLSNRMTTQDAREWHFQAQAFYRVGADGAISGTWVDSRGVSLPLAGVAEPGLLTIHWGTETSVERGRSSYRIAAGAVEITDEVQTADGGWRVFGRSRLARME